MLTVSSHQQIILLIYSFAVGAAMSLLYDLMRIFRRLSKASGTKSVFAQDLIYCVTVTAVYIIFIYAANLGIPRLFSMISAAAGFLFFHFTVGSIVVTAGEKAAKTVWRIFRCVFFIIIRPLEIILAFLTKKIKNILCKLTICKKIFKNLFIFVKKRIKIYLYTARICRSLKRK